MTDGELVRQTLSGHAPAYAALARRYAARVVGVCHARVGRAAAAEDLAQEALVRGLEALRTLTDPEKFGPWVCGIASRACLDWLKRAERRNVSLDAAPDGTSAGSNGHPVAPTPTPADEAERHDETARLMAAVERLPAPLREALMLYYYEDCTYAELAARLGVSAATVNARLTQARQSLRADLGAARQSGAWPARRATREVSPAPP
ncbi:MAG TPA: sigma-70 family RNA polymerase sigma factor [Tepidisphaeraceae bacterium]|nr:sigma-70 family RNA polymerase sigma factor [Tepidisphaeraceae bacterium]